MKGHLNGGSGNHVPRIDNKEVVIYPGVEFFDNVSILGSPTLY